jgi:hypothetical protein
VLMEVWALLDAGEVEQERDVKLEILSNVVDGPNLIKRRPSHPLRRGCAAELRQQI